MVRFNQGGVWRILPSHGNGVAVISLGYIDALRELKRGFIHIGGLRAHVEGIAFPEDDTSLALRLRFDDPAAAAQAFRHP